MCCCELLLPASCCSQRTRSQRGATALALLCVCYLRGRSWQAERALLFAQKQRFQEGPACSVLVSLKALNGCRQGWPWAAGTDPSVSQPHTSKAPLAASQPTWVPHRTAPVR